MPRARITWRIFSFGARRFEGTESGHGTMVHIAVSGLSIRSPQAPEGHIRDLSHLPFAEDAIDQSVTELVETLQEPPVGDGYGVWREAFDKGEAGVFTVPLGQLVALTEQSMSKSAEPSVAAPK